jgi:hypothetical protein
MASLEAQEACVTPAWCVALVVTLVIEVPIVAAFFPRERVRMALVAAVANTATNLTLNLVLARMVVLGGHRMLIGEGLALFGEAAAYGAFSRTQDLARGVVASGVSNALSFAAGFVPVSLLR